MRKYGKYSATPDFLLQLYLAAFKKQLDKWQFILNSDNLLVSIQKLSIIDVYIEEYNYIKSYYDEIGGFLIIRNLKCGHE